MSTLKIINLQHPSNANNNVVLDANGNMTCTGTVVGGSSLGMRNRIINGDMRIDQRNAGSSITGNDGSYGVDRWCIEASQSSKFTIQQNAGSVTPPSGYTNYLGITSSSSYSSLTGDYFNLVQRIEGYNVADLDFGKSTAKTVTVSFWVRSSLTGTFGGSLRNAGGNRSYPFTYTISAANTWEQKTVTIPGDTTGTWPTTNASSFNVYFNLGTGTQYSGPAGSWAAQNYVNVSGTVSVLGTSGATWYLTGVQLEVGTAATPFERRQYGHELRLCQRYYCKSFQQGTAPSVANYNGGVRFMASNYYCDGNSWFSVNFPVSMRAAPTITLYSPSGTGQISYRRNNSTSVNGAAGTPSSTTDNFNLTGDYTGAGTNSDIRSVAFDYTASAEL